MTTLETPSTSDLVRYLVVDDHEPFRRMVEAYLADPACEIFECSNGRDAVEQCDAVRPDWVLMDIEMPDMDGLEATRLIRERFPEVRILLLTQQESPEIRKAASASGATCFLAKDNLEKLVDLLHQPPVGRSVPNPSPTEPPILP